MLVFQIQTGLRRSTYCAEHFELDRLGPFYFISGTEENCQKGEKMSVVVLSPRHHGSSLSAPAPAQEGPTLTVARGALFLGQLARTAISRLQWTFTPLFFQM
uniref:Phytocyanin domain-containing protein n=1 Tax=Nelumbo nucifera TaxID=4432 RepID=A0A822YY40_NELNU|nr:TPA_asm: hypothetical protein HUJ06_004808 [Nelumbo nucifera]